MWTKEQQEAIESRDCNILVSAAAGSGKTAVLTERIVNMIVSGEADADRLIVVTFTKAAAAEMRERIRRGLEKKFNEDRSDNRLYTQMTLLAEADISTIDSFCARLVKTHFEEAGIDPGYRIAETAELELLMTDVFSEVIEEFYVKGDEDFFEFVGAFSSSKNDTDIETIVKRVYNVAQNKPWPHEWLEGSVFDPNVIDKYTGRIRVRLTEYAKSFGALEKLIIPGSGLDKYVAFLYEEIMLIKAAISTKDNYQLYKTLAAIPFDTLPKPEKGYDSELKELCKSFRDSYKKYIRELVPDLKKTGIEGEEDFFLGGRISKKDEAYIAKTVRVIIELTKAFSDRLTAEKEKRNIVTFNDIEHKALEILIERSNNQSKLKETAVELKDYYIEILTDEYQDSNELQEAILSAVSNGKNRYMVGDIKQSIYAFRGGDPTLFSEKYNSFDKEGNQNGKKIILQNNFRSRCGVLESCNHIFEAVMNKEYTGISYDAEARLIPTKEFKDSNSPELTFAGNNGKTVCNVILKNNDEKRPDEVLQGIRIAQIIKGYFEENRQVYDTKKDDYRRITYKDIVVLCRKTDTCALIADALNAEDIPAFAESKSSYIDTFEIRPVIAFLKVIDNPLDDVEFTAVMLSYFGGFTADEVAVLRGADTEEFFYRGLCCYEFSPKQAELQKKVNDFLAMLDEYRQTAAFLSVYDLLWRIIYETGYYSYVGMLPAKKRRLANLDLFLNRAFKYTGTSYNGLFQFLRYVEKLEDTDSTKGEVSALTELQNVVRVMTIHKSKGLEFPVVFLAGMEKKINTDDATDKRKTAIDGDILVTDVYDTKRRVKRITAYKRSVQKNIKQRFISEELRLLYVGMTRAVEKLVITGVYKGDDLSKVADDCVNYQINGKFGYAELDGAVTFFRLFLPVIIKASDEGSDLFELVETQSSDIIQSETDMELPSDKEMKKVTDSDDDFTDILDFEYPYKNEIDARPKVTVSELKRMSYADETEKALDYRISYGDEETDEEFSTFSSYTKEDVTTGAGRGTLYHKLMECIDLSKCKDETGVNGEIERLKNKRLIPEDAQDHINAADIVTFALSDIGRRVCSAIEEGRAKREQQFMTGVDADERSDLLLVQGVIDLYFEEEDCLVLVDYKTDRVNKNKGADILKKRYNKQLEIYARSLEAATGKPIKEMLIYSFSLGRAISCHYDTKVKV